MYWNENKEWAPIEDAPFSDYLTYDKEKKRIEIAKLADNTLAGKQYKLKMVATQYKSPDAKEQLVTLNVNPDCTLEKV